MHQVNVNEVVVPKRPPAGVASFAIDSPRPGDASLGDGLEITGWVIGVQEPVQGVRTVVGARKSRIYPLDVLRPDVATDYPDIAHSGSSGFTAWASIDSGAGNWRLQLEAILATGESKPLAEVTGVTLLLMRCGGPGGTAPLLSPDFIIIGAQRGGTTSLHAYLSAHPQIRTPTTKELHYLTDRYERGRDWYVGQFPTIHPCSEITGEATPYALFHPLAPERLARIAPRAKLIALLRNPVARAYSHYLHERSRGFETLDFAAALDAESERLAGEDARLAQDPTYVSEAHKHFSYLARGDYALQLARWFAHVPRDQMLILRSEDLYKQPAQTVAQVAAFLGIAPDLDAPFAAHNRSTGPPLDPAVRARLAEYFAPRNARLADLLGWDPDWD